MRKRETKFKSVFQSDTKTKYEVQIRFSKLGEKEKQKVKFKSVFQCHAKTTVAHKGHKNPAIYFGKFEW